MAVSSGRPIRNHAFVPLESVSLLGSVRNLAIVQSPPPQQTRKGSVNVRDPDHEALIGVTDNSAPLSTSRFSTTVTYITTVSGPSIPYTTSTATFVLTDETILLSPLSTSRFSTIFTYITTVSGPARPYTTLTATSILTDETILLAPTISTSESPALASSKSDPPLGAIIGGVVGGITVVTAIFVIIFFRKRGRAQKGRHQNLDITALSVPRLAPPLLSHETNGEKARQIVSQWSHPEHRESDDVDAEGARPEVESLIHNREPADSTNAALVEMRAHIQLIAERMAKMEAELAPPDYVSRGSE